MKRIINNIIIKTHIVYRIYQEVWYGGGGFDRVVSL